MVGGSEQTPNLTKRRILKFFCLFPQDGHPDAEKSIAFAVLAWPCFEKSLRMLSDMRIGESLENFADFLGCHSWYGW